MRVKKALTIFVAMLVMTGISVQTPSLARDVSENATIASREGYPKRYNSEEYLKLIKKEYRKVTKDENIAVAIDMMKDTNADFSRSALLGYNLTKKPVKIMFKDLSKIDEKYASFDALGWKKGTRLYIYIRLGRFIR